MSDLLMLIKMLDEEQDEEDEEPESQTLFYSRGFQPGVRGPWWSATVLQWVREIHFDISTHFQITLEYREKYI